MAVDGGSGAGGGLPSKKKKKPSSGGGSSSGSSSYDATPKGYGSAPKSSPVYHAPKPSYTAPKYSPGAPSSSGYSAPPSYSRITPKKPKTSKQPSIFDVLQGIQTRSSAGHDRKEDLANLLFKPQIGKKPTPEFGEDDGRRPNEELPEGFQRLLESLKGSSRPPKAPEGYTPGAEHLEEGEFAFVPDRFKTTGPKDRLKAHWDLDFIESSRSDFTYASQYQDFINGIMEKQYYDQENWLQTRNENMVGRKREILDEASQAAFDGDYEWLEREHPNFDTDLPGYRQHFGVTPEDIIQDWKATRGQINDPYMRPEMRQRADIMREHFERLRGSKDSNYFNYAGSQAKVNDAFKKYEEKYQDSIEFGLKSSDDEKRSAAEAANKLDSPWDWLDRAKKDTQKDDRALINAAGESLDPNSYVDFHGFFGLPSKNRKANKRAVEKARTHAMSMLGTPNLPSVKQMVTYAVRSGELNPDNERAVEAAIDKFRNPNHPDTRAWYVSHVMNRNPEFDAKGKGLAFINEPVLQYLEAEGKRKAGNEAADRDADLNSITGPLDAASDVWDTMTWQGIPTMDVRAQGGGAGVKGTVGNPGALDTNQIGWTFDKLMRFNYAVAGAANEYYSMDKDGGGRNVFEKYHPYGAFSHLTGQGTFSSVDELIKNPAQILDIADEGYQQFFRGSSLPGIKKDIVPTTWSHVVANNAARDPENNHFDEEWFQHVSGFILDVGTDPLNFIGVGTASAVLKVPKRVLKQTAAAEKAAKEAGDLPTVKNIEILRKLKETKVEGASPQVNFNFRVDQAVRQIGDDVSGVQHKYANDDDFWNSPEIQADTEEVANLANQRDALKMQERKLSNDAGIDDLQWQMRELKDEILLADVVSETDFTHWKIMDATTSKIDDMPIKGGRWQTEYIDPLETGAKGTGLYDEVFDDTALGREAQVARDRIAKLEDDVTLDPNSLAVRKEISRLNNAIRKAEDAGEVRKIPKVDEYMKDPTFRKPAFDPAVQIARSVGKSKEWLLKATGLTDEDFHRAVMEGPIQYRNSDPRADALWKDGEQRKAEYKEHLTLKGITKEKIAALTKARNIGLEMQNTVIVEGMMRYIKAASQMKRSGAPVEVQTMRADVLDKINKLESLKAQVGQELDRNYSGIVDEGEEVAGYVGGFEKGRDFKMVQRGHNYERRYTDDDGLALDKGRWYEGEDFADRTLEDILSDPHGSKNIPQHLSKVQEELDNQIEELYPKLMGEEASAMSQARAQDAERLLPKSSMLRNSKGDIDVDKVFKEYLGFSPHNHNVWIKLPEGATAADQTFMETIAGGVRSIYQPTYSIVRTERLGYKAVDDTPEPWKPGDPYRKPSANPGPKERALGSRPTAKSLEGLKNAIGDKPKKSVKKGDPEVDVVNPKTPEEYDEAVRLLDERTNRSQEIIDEQHSSGKITPEQYQEHNDALAAWYEKHLAWLNEDRIAGTKTGDLPPNYRVEEYLEFQGGVKGVPGAYERKAPKVSYNAGKRTPGQKRWDELVERKQREWDKALAKAQDADAKALKDKPRTPEFKQKPTDKVEIAREAYKRAVDSVKAGLKEGRVEPFPGTMRMTINEKAKSARDVVNLQHRLDLADLRLAELNAANVHELRSLRAKRGALTKKKKAQLAKIEAARKEAHDTRVQMQRVIEEEHILNLNAMGPDVSKRMLQIHIMGMRKNLQWTHHLWDMAEGSAKFVPAKFRESYANNFIRPTKRLDTHEAIHMRARYESLTPVVIHGNLTNMKRRMGDIDPDERIKMFEHYRRGAKDMDYEGPMMHQYEDAMFEIRDIEDIWNGTNSNYWFAPRRGEVLNDSLRPEEIYRFLPERYRPDLRTLYRLQNMEKDGRITADVLIKAMKGNPLSKSGDMIDPFRFSWTMRLAADQASAYRSLTHAMENTFGVAKRVGYNSKANVLRTLQEKHGWDTVEGLSKDILFPPSLQNDVKQLLKLAEPGKEQAKFSKMVDTGIGYWKQSMTIYNPGYYTRNGIGEMMTSWLDGVNDPAWYARSYKVHKYAKDLDGPLVKLKKKFPVLEGKIPGSTIRGSEKIFTLPKSGYKVTVADVDYWYAQTGLKSTFANTDIGQGLRGLAVSAYHKGKIRKTANKINEGAHEAGEGFEDYLRRAHFMHAMEHSGAGSVERAAYLAAQRVRRSHFDYTDFSPFEKTVMLRGYPFYKWTRRGAPLMFAHLFLTPGKMSALPKAMDTISGLGLDPVGMFNDDPVLSTSDVLDDKNGNLPDYHGIAPGWVRDLWAYQINPAPDDEYQNYFRVQTPQVDGLNAVLNAMPFIGNNDAGLNNMFQESGAYPLLNPVIKGGIELGANKSMDPDFPYQIYGGYYNEKNDISNLDAIGTYIARSTNPIAGFLAKMSKNGQMPVDSLNMGDGSYRDEHGYAASRDVASFITGLGFYQGKAMPANQEEATSPRSVGKYELSDLPTVRGRKAAVNNPSKVSPTRGTNYRGRLKHDASSEGYSGTEHGSGWIDYPDYPEGSGWINYPDRPWINYGSYGSGYSGGGGSGGYGGSSSSGFSSSGSSSLSFAALIEALKRMIDQGQVYDG